MFIAMVVALAVAAIVAFGAVSAVQAFAAADDGSATATADIVLVAPGADAPSPAPGHTRSASPSTGDALPWMPLALVAMACAALAAVARRRSKDASHRGAHARTRGGLLSVFLVVLLVGSGASMVPLGLQAQAADAGNAIRIELSKGDDGKLTGSTTYYVDNDATYYRDVVKLLEEANEGYSFTDGSIEITVAPAADPFDYVSSKDAVKGAATSGGNTWRVPGSAVSQEHRLALTVSASAEGLEAGEHAVGTLTCSMEAPVYDALTAGFSSDPLVGSPIEVQAANAPSEAANAFTYAWLESGDGETWQRLGNTAASITPDTGMVGALLAAEVSCVNPAWFAVTPARAVTAERVVPTYIVTYDANGHGTAPAAARGVPAGSKVSAPEAPTADGYVFGGWYREATCENAWDFDADTVEADMTLYAKWSPVTYVTISFDANGGAGEMADVTAAVGSTVTLPASAFSRTGYTFLGWNTASDGSGAFYADKASRNDFGGGSATVTLYAQWQGKSGVRYTVEHYKRNDANDGYNSAPADTDSLTGVAGTLTAAVAKDYSSAGFEAQPFEQAEIAGDGSTVVKVYYDWKTYTVTYQTWGQPVAKEKDEGVLHGSTVTAPATPVEGQGDPRFDGWYADAGFTTSFSFSTPITKDTTVYAKYYPVLTVKFENGLLDDVAFPKTLNSSFAESELSALPHPGYDIAGYFTDNTFATSQTFPIAMDSDKVVWAKLTPRNDTPYTVKHLQQSLSDPSAYEEVVADRQSLAGTTGGQTSAAAKSYDGFTAQTVVQQAIAADGSTVVEIKYDRNTNTAYKVKHYWQNIDDDEYVLHETDNETGVTGATTEAAAKTYAGFAAKPFSQTAIGGDGNTVVKIYYDRQTYTVAFDANGHGANPATQTVRYGGKAAEPAALTDAVHEFKGWYTDSGCTTSYDFDTAVQESMTLYGKWEKKKFTVTFVVDTVKAQQPDAQSVEYGEKATEPQNVAKTGYTLIGWYKESGYQNIFDFVNEVITENVSVYGRLEQSYTVTYNANGGEGAPEAQAKIRDVDLTLSSDTPTKASGPVTYTVTYDANGGSSTGATDNKATATANASFTFAGWNTSEDGAGTNYEPGATYSDNADLTLYAKWTENAETATSVTLPNPTYDGKRFMGWFDAPTGGNKVGGAGDSYTPDKDITLHAQWASAIIHFNARGTASGLSGYAGSGTMTDQEVDPTTGYQVKAITFEAPATNIGFIGWNTAQDGSGRWVLPGETIHAGDTTLVDNGGEATLYAQWSHFAGKSASDVASLTYDANTLGDIWVSDELNLTEQMKVTRDVDKRMFCRLIGTENNNDGDLVFMAVRELPISVQGVNYSTNRSYQPWPNTGLYASFAPGGSVYNMMPSSLTSSVKAVAKKYRNQGTIQIAAAQNYWLISQSEITGYSTDRGDEGQRYAYFVSKGWGRYVGPSGMGKMNSTSTPVKDPGNSENGYNQYADNVWGRSTDNSSNTGNYNVMTINKEGGISGGGGYVFMGVAPCFVL